MILRRFSEAIARQDWAIIIIEIMVVVVGIFIGLQVDDWNESRKDRVDEQVFIQTLHSDLLLAEKLSARVRERRLSRLNVIIEAMDVLFNNSKETLTPDECLHVSSSNFFNITVSDLASLEELIGAGRLDIIQDAELLTALVELQQTREGLATMVSIQTSSSTFTHLPSNFPELITTVPYIDTETGEVRSQSICDAQGMRANRKFLNQFAVNADGYDAYVRDGLAPWSKQFDEVHELVDKALNITGH